jgi:hypothetical protein
MRSAHRTQSLLLVSAFLQSNKTDIDDIASQIDRLCLSC